ncbi:MAG: ATP-dependent DNA helicase RecG, partial [Pseudomonadota bacterium]
DRAPTGLPEAHHRPAATLPFPLTGAQARCVTEIINDLRSPDRMVRLLQGDVGSGKTAVAFLAMAHMAASGFQSAMMAPTELLARQHFATLSAFAEPAELSIVCLTGKTKAAEAHATRAAIADGSVDMIIGTQALFQESVSYARLGLAVIDEQHRFGVHQRLDLAAKGEDVDLLVTTATPIPRTLLLSFYGDMDVSKIDEKPAGRPEIDTRIISGERIEEVIAAIRRALERGERIYWICPLVAESEAIDAQAAEARYEDLKQRLGPSVGLVHGRMSPEEKDKVTEAFRSGETGVLVATTVVEVGVDVPDATVIVIESAERFGLAQLHQLRGRVGRGTRASFCLLLYTPPLGETALKRLSVLRETNDGFRIAEEDLTARGGGDMLGVRQSGMPGFRLVRPEAHLDLIDTARQDARLTLDEDPGLASERGQAIRVLLHLFERVEATRFLDSG